MGKKRPGPLRVERTPREVIQSKLLVAIDRHDKVALVADAEDLELLIIALDLLRGMQDSDEDRARQMADDISELYRQAFNSEPRR